MRKGRKSAFAAVGRISRNYLVQDGVIPRSEIARVLREIAELSARTGLRVANVFHAGDGNLHPLILFDSRLGPDELERAKAAGLEILTACVEAGGSITGEHGVGLDKSDYLPLIFSEDDMDTMLRVRAAFDPTGLCNPGKIIPTPRTCSEGRASAIKFETVALGARPSLPASVREHANLVRAEALMQARMPALPGISPPHLFNSDEASRLIAQIVGGATEGVHV